MFRRYCYIRRNILLKPKSALFLLQLRDPNHRIPTPQIKVRSLPIPEPTLRVFPLRMHPILSPPFPVRISKNRFTITCMDLSNCEYLFSEDEIRRFLSTKVFERFDQLRTDFELRQVLPPLADFFLSRFPCPFLFSPPLTPGLIVGRIRWARLVPFLSFCGAYGARGRCL